MIKIANNIVDGFLLGVCVITLGSKEVTGVGFGDWLFITKNKVKNSLFVLFGFGVILALYAQELARKLPAKRLLEYIYMPILGALTVLAYCLTAYFRGKSQIKK